MFKFTRHRTLLTLLVAVIATLALDGCGLKGPLYRPDQVGQNGQPNSSPVKRKKSPFDRAPAPQAQKDSATPAPENKPGEESDSSTPSIDPDRPTPPTPTP